MRLVRAFPSFSLTCTPVRPPGANSFTSFCSNDFLSDVLNCTVPSLAPRFFPHSTKLPSPYDNNKRSVPHTPSRSYHPMANFRYIMDRWRSWNAAKLPGRAVNRFVRGWVSRRLTIEVHRTACIVTHPPAGERLNDALVNPANERLAGTRFTPDECWRELYGDPLTGRWARDYATYPLQSIDGLVTEFGGDGLQRELEAVEVLGLA